ncbi:MAG: hypothetical protein II969_18505 [Anaerolineaceae bacterium]|nr:hypothetical protein [Anaerolineaceae bacterium]
MNTIEATMSMLEFMPEDAQLMVFNYTKTLFTSFCPSNPFTPVTIDQIISDLNESHNQIAAGEGMPMKEALLDLGKKHGFI